MKIKIVFTLLALLSFAVQAKTIEEQQAECTGPTVEWNSDLNACMTTQQTLETKEEFDSCAASADPESCYNKIAEDTSGVKKGEGKKGKYRGLEIGGQAAAGAYSVFTLVGAKAKEGANGKCMSKKIFAGTSAAWVLGDFFLRKTAKDNFKELEEKYRDEAKNMDQKGSSDGSYQAQVRAFAYLKEEQNLVMQQSDKRANLQMVVMLGYGVSFAMAVYETMMMKTPAGLAKACHGGPGEAPGKSKIDLRSSPSIAAASGIMLGLSTVLMLEARKQKKDSEQNIKDIDEALEGFAQHMAGYCPDGREDLQNARCYCYTESGDKNENRTNSAICQSLWSSDLQNFNLAPTDYDQITSGPAQVCLRKDGEIDETCRCKKLVNKKTGQNACHSTPLSANLTGNYGTKIGAANTLDSIEKFPQGANTALGSLNGNALKKAVARNTKALDSLVEQARAQGTPIRKPSELEAEANKLALSSATPKALAAYQGRGIGLNGHNRFRPAAVQRAVDQAKQNSEGDGDEKDVALVGGKGLISGKKKANPFKFKWNEGAARAGNKVSNFNSADKAQEIINNSDINNRKDVSIFKVISRRYQISGLRYLFGD